MGVALQIAWTGLLSYTPWIGIVVLNGELNNGDGRAGPAGSG
jgi:hypothetical protein